jgi:hypothetical protein
MMLLPLKLNKLHKYFVTTTIKYELISRTHGLYFIENEQISWVNILNSSINISRASYGKHKFIIDSSKYVRDMGISQLPIDYIFTKIVQFTYAVSESGFALIVEFIYNGSDTPFELNDLSVHIDDAVPFIDANLGKSDKFDYCRLTPINMYFTYGEPVGKKQRGPVFSPTAADFDLEHAIWLRDEFNMLLSQLN